ncbi:uncharacterized protein LOC124143523 [Haliotis rufescens]|uniref:uncharacterized protein LOC124143523 n=1 Tax=Haliotis rufescens TaxID=6454 RepID=UPI00201F8865|nr:uncharacterized protein LOC124143523 [Haliotis rufescens]
MCVHINSAPFQHPLRLSFQQAPSTMKVIVFVAILALAAAEELAPELQESTLASINKIRSANGESDLVWDLFDMIEADGITESCEQQEMPKVTAAIFSHGTDIDDAINKAIANWTNEPDALSEITSSATRVGCSVQLACPMVGRETEPVYVACKFSA